LIPGFPQNKKYSIHGIGFEFCGYAFPPVKILVPLTIENHFLEDMEKVPRFLFCCPIQLSVTKKTHPRNVREDDMGLCRWCQFVLSNQQLLDQFSDVPLIP
jgi:hypothetical protein